MAEKGVSASAAAAHLCVSSPTFAKLINQGVFERKPCHIGYNLDVIRAARFRYLENAAAGRSGADGGALLAKERALLAREQREATQIKNELARGELVHLSLVERVLGEMFNIARETPLNMPGKTADAVAAACGGDRALVFRILDDEIREMLDLLSAPDLVVKATVKQQLRVRRAEEVEA
jgi:hypothetical protein